MIFANRAAGALARLGGRASFESYARDAGFEPELVYTRNGAHLRRLLRERVVGKVPRVALAGGDGTIHTAVQVLAGSDVALGILPLGTANNFASALRLPVDLPSAFRVLAEGEERAVDLGECEGEYFTEAAGMGLFADILAITGAGHRPRNIARGFAMLFRTLLTNRPRRMTLEIDGVPHVEEVLTVTVANSFCVGYNIPIAPCARVTDAELDVVVVERLHRSEVLPYYRAIRSQAHMDLPKVKTMRARMVRITGRHSAIVHVDDRAWRRTPVTIRVAPGALRVMVDRL